MKTLIKEKKPLNTNSWSNLYIRKKSEGLGFCLWNGFLTKHQDRIALSSNPVWFSFSFFPSATAHLQDRIHVKDTPFPVKATISTCGLESCTFSCKANPQTSKKKPTTEFQVNKSYSVWGFGTSINFQSPSSNIKYEKRRKGTNQRF